MNDYYRKVYEQAPESVTIPAQLRHRRVEVLILPLESSEPDEETIGADSQPVDDNGWPVGSFQKTAGMWAGEPLVRAPQGDYEARLEIE